MLKFHMTYGKIDNGLIWQEDRVRSFSLLNSEQRKGPCEMDTNYYRNNPALNRYRRRRRRRNKGLVPVVMLSILLAVLTGLAVRITVFGKIAPHMEGKETEPAITNAPILELPESVQLKSLNLPVGAAIEPQELVEGLEGSNITVSFAIHLLKSLKYRF